MGATRLAVRVLLGALLLARGHRWPSGRVDRTLPTLAYHAANVRLDLRQGEGAMTLFT